MNISARKHLPHRSCIGLFKCFSGFTTCILKRLIHTCCCYRENVNVKKKSISNLLIRRSCIETSKLQTSFCLEMAVWYSGIWAFARSSKAPCNVICQNYNEIFKTIFAQELDRTLGLAKTCIGTPYYMSPEMFRNVPYVISLCRTKLFIASTTFQIICAATDSNPMSGLLGACCMRWPR